LELLKFPDANNAHENKMKLRIKSRDAINLQENRMEIIY